MLKGSSFRFSKLLKEKLNHQIPQVRDRLRVLQKEKSKKVIDHIDVGSVVGGMRGLPLIFYLCSHLDPIEGIRFRNLTISEMHAKLPRIDKEPLPEAVLWLLLTGEIPTTAELNELTNTIVDQRPLPESTEQLIANYAKSHHPMTTLTMAIMDLQKYSKFAPAISNHTLKKSQYWEATLEDGLFLLRHMPRIAALIYTTKYDKKSASLVRGDWAGNYADLLGYPSDSMAEVLRTYLSIHCDHEGGNVSAHTSYLVSSALSDPFLAFSAAVNGLAGPLHGLASQEVMKFLLALQTHLKSKSIAITSSEDVGLQKHVQSFVEDWVKTKVVPGYGHARLRIVDPRFTHQKKLSLEIMPDKELIKLTHVCEKVVPGVLANLGKVKNPFPNVDAHSGVLLYELGLTQFEYYTVVFAVSRAIGCVSNMVWARAMNLPIEYARSLTLDNLEHLAKDFHA